MNIQEAIAIHLLAIPALDTIVSDRIYRGRLPKNQTIKPPHIIIWLLSKTRINDHDGYSGVTEATLQISCFSHDPDEVNSMATLVRESLESWSDVIDVFFEDESDGFEEATAVYHIPLDFKISYHE